jgi:hypothetical protein
VIKIKPVSLSLIPKLKLDSGKFSKLKTKVITAGWGLRYTDEYLRPSNVLMEVEMPITGCGPALEAIYKKQGIEFESSKLCAGVFDEGKTGIFTPKFKASDFKSIGEGDSGGPLYYMNGDVPVLVGITSHIIAMQGELHGQLITCMPSIFTKISDPVIMDFIRKYTREESNEIGFRG